MIALGKYDDLTNHRTLAFLSHHPPPPKPSKKEKKKKRTTTTATQWIKIGQSQPREWKISTRQLVPGGECQNTLGEYNLRLSHFVAIVKDSCPMASAAIKIKFPSLEPIRVTLNMLK